MFYIEGNIFDDFPVTHMSFSEITFEVNAKH